MTKSRTIAEVDEELFQAARQALGTRGLEKTMEQAFEGVQRCRARQDEVESLSAMTDYDLDDPEVMSGAWRQ